MTRGGLLAGAVVLGAGIGGSATAAPIAFEHLGPAGFGLAYADGGAAVPTAFAEWMPAASLAARKPGIDRGGFLGGPAVAGLEEGAGAHDASFSAGGAAAEALLASLIRRPILDAASMLRPAGNLRLLPGGPGGAPEAWLIPSSRTSGDSPPPGAGGDPLVHYAVPALAAASLPAAGLLLFGLVQRWRRAALVRRVRSAASGYDRRPARRRR